MKKTILVTGGLGYIGSHTVVELASAGYRPVIIDNLSNSSVDMLPRIEQITGQTIPFYEQDFQHTERLATVLRNEHVTGIIHFAAFKAVGESVKKPLSYYKNNVAGLVSLLEVVEALKQPIQVIFSSSCTVYGNADTQPITESAPHKPAASPYGSTKQMCETILHDATQSSKTLSSVSLRYFNPIGAHQSGLIGELPIGTPANLIPFVTQTAAGLRESLTVFGDDYPTVDGTCVRDYIHVVDLAKAHIKALEYAHSKPAKTYDVFNVGTGQATSVLEVIQRFKAATGQQVPYKIGPRRDGDIVTCYADPSKANKVLGWHAENSLDQALHDAWRWQQNLGNPL